MCVEKINRMNHMLIEDGCNVITVAVGLEAIEFLQNVTHVRTAYATVSELMD